MISFDFEIAFNSKPLRGKQSISKQAKKIQNKNYILLKIKMRNITTHKCFYGLFSSFVIDNCPSTICIVQHKALSHTFRKCFGKFEFTVSQPMCTQHCCHIILNLNKTLSCFFGANVGKAEQCSEIDLYVFNKEVLHSPILPAVCIALLLP